MPTFWVGTLVFGSGAVDPDPCILVEQIAMKGVNGRSCDEESCDVAFHFLWISLCVQADINCTLFST